MRVPIIPTTQNKATATRLYPGGRKANVKLQVLDAVTLYVAVSENENELISGLDPVGNPERGLQLGQGVYDFLGITKPIFGLCNQQTSVEVQWWLV